MASSYWRAFPPGWAVALLAFVRFTVTGIARKLHPCSHDASPIRGGRAAPLGRRYTGYSFVAPYYTAGAAARQRFFRKAAHPGPFTPYCTNERLCRQGSHPPHRRAADGICRPQARKAYQLCPPFEPMAKDTAQRELLRRHLTHYGPPPSGMPPASSARRKHRSRKA